MGLWQAMCATRNAAKFMSSIWRKDMYNLRSDAVQCKMTGVVKVSRRVDSAARRRMGAGAASSVSGSGRWRQR